MNILPPLQWWNPMKLRVISTCVTLYLTPLTLSFTSCLLVAFWWSSFDLNLYVINCYVFYLNKQALLKLIIGTSAKRFAVTERNNHRIHHRLVSNKVQSQKEKSYRGFTFWRTQPHSYKEFLCIKMTLPATMDWIESQSANHNRVITLETYKLLGWPVLKLTRLPKTTIYSPLGQSHLTQLDWSEPMLNPFTELALFSDLSIHDHLRALTRSLMEKQKTQVAVAEQAQPIKSPTLIAANRPSRIRSSPTSNWLVGLDSWNIWLSLSLGTVQRGLEIGMAMDPHSPG